MAAARGHIFNLGHGILPNTPPENAKYLVDCVKELSIKYHERAVTHDEQQDNRFRCPETLQPAGAAIHVVPDGTAIFAGFYRRGFQQRDHRDTTEDNDRPLSLYFHFPFCAKLCYFCGCTMRVTHDRKLISQYNDYIKKRDRSDRSACFKEPKGRADALGRRHAVISFAGRDPRDRQLHQRAISISIDDIEASVEIDPRNMVRDHIEAFADSRIQPDEFWRAGF